MSSEKFQEILKSTDPPERSTGTVIEGIQAIFPGLSFDKFLDDLGKEGVHQAKLGAHEVATAILHGHDPYVMYDRNNNQQQQPEHGLSNDIVPLEVAPLEQEQSRGYER